MGKFVTWEDKRNKSTHFTNSDQIIDIYRHPKDATHTFWIVLSEIDQNQLSAYYEIDEPVYNAVINQLEEV